MTPHDSLPLALDEARSGADGVALGAQAVLLCGFARECSPELIAAIDAIAAVSPFHHMVTPWGMEDVGGPDQLRTSLLGHGSQWIPLRPY